MPNIIGMRFGLVKKLNKNKNSFKSNTVKENKKEY